MEAEEHILSTLKNKASFSTTSPLQHHNHSKSSEKGSSSHKANTKSESDCYGLDIAALNIFENQVIPVSLHTILRDVIKKLGTKFFLFSLIFCGSSQISDCARDIYNIVHCIFIFLYFLAMF